MNSPTLPPGFTIESTPTREGEASFGIPAGFNAPPLPPGFQVESTPVLLAPMPIPRALAPTTPAPAFASAPASLGTIGFGDGDVPDAGKQMARSVYLHLPHELRGYTPEELASPGGFINPRTGQQSTVRGDLARVPVIDAPIGGVEQASQGIAQMAQPSSAEKLRGAGKVALGALGVATPALTALGAAAPLEAAGWYALSKGIGQGTAQIAAKGGMNPEDARETGELTSVVPLLYGFGKIAEGRFADAIEAHNARAEELINQDAQHGHGVDMGEHIVGEEIPLSNTKGWKVVPNGASRQGRPNFVVLDAEGKALFGGNGREVQSFLESRGVERTQAEAPAPDPAARVSTKAPGGKRTAPVVPSESPLTADAGRVGETLQPPPETPAPEPPASDSPQAPAPAPAPAIDLGGMGKAISGNLYEMLFDRLSQGKTTEAGSPSRILTKAKPLFDAGLIKSPEEFQAWVNAGEPTSAPAPAETLSAAPAIPEGFTVEHVPAKAEAPEPDQSPIKASEPQRANAEAPREAASAPAAEGERRAAGTGGEYGFDAPWQMTRQEWYDAKGNDRAETFDTRNARSGASEVSARAARKAWLNYGAEGALTDSGREPVDHQQVIEKALDEGQPVPEHVRADYPDLGEQPKPSQQQESRGTVHYGDATRIPVPGEKTVYPARYALRELADVQPSHNGQSFEPNPAYEHRNDRDYSKSGNAERIVRQAASFEPSYLLSDNPDAVNGAPIVDRRGNVLGGNSRAITLGRVYGSRPEAAQNYREMLEAKAPAFGLDREAVRAMKQPVLVREADDTEDPQKAITDFNKTGTAALTTSERAVADARRVSSDTLEYLAHQIADEGDDATLAKVLGGPKGPRLIQRLIDDGVITPQEKGQYIDERGLVTAEGKTRLTRTVVGRLFDTSADFEQAAPELRNKLERVVGPLARVDEMPGWALTSQTKEAVRMLGEARARGIRNLDDLASQNNLFGGGERDGQALAIAHTLQGGPRKAAAAFQQYASDAEIGRGGATLAFLEPPTAAESFEAAFQSEESVLHAKELKRLDPTSEYDPQRILEETEWEVLPANDRRPVRVRVNEQGTGALAMFMRQQHLDAGLALRPKTLTDIVSNVRNLTELGQRRGLLRGEAVANAHRFADALEQAGSMSGSEPLVIYRSAAPESILSRSRLLREELTHVEQFRKSGAAVSDHVEAERVTADPAWPIVKTNLRRKGYKGSDAQLVTEATAQLAAGRATTLGVGRADAIRILSRYFEALTERHGLSGAQEVLQHAEPWIRSELRLGGRHPRRSGLRQPANPGTGESEHASEPEGGPLRSMEARRRSGAGREVQRTLSDAADRARSLFDTGTDEQVAADAARDRDQLTGDRLTAQLNAPLTREEQLGKLKTSKSQKQSALFEDNSDAQGSFFLGSGLGAMQPFVTQFLKDDVVPTARQTAEVLKLAGDDVRKVFAPASRGADAKATAMSVRANAAELARSTDRAQAALQVASKYFAGQPAADNYAFMDAVETGSAQANGQLDQVAKVMREMLDTRREAIQQLGTGKLSNWIENYFPHLWEQNGKARQIFDGRRPLEGGKAFLKGRKIATIADGLALGLKPISDNPVDLVLAKAREMDKYLAAHHILADMKNAGVLEYKRATAPMPDGFAAIDDKVATVYGTPSHDGALQIEGHWVAPEPAARVLNNYLSPGLSESSAMYRAYLGAANLMNQAQLGFSAFHLAFTSMDVLTSKLALGLYKIGHGDLLKGMKDIALTPAAPIANILRGDKLLKEWYAPGSQGGTVSALVDAVVQAGGRAHMDAHYQTQITKRMVDAFRKGNVLGATLRVPFAALEQAARPIMEYIVPRQKLGVFADLAKYELERAGGDVDGEGLQAALQRAWDSVDNRLGQLVYDNLFWSKVAKDLAMGSVRSVGWNVGTIRELAGALPDTAKFASGKGDFTPRMSYMLALPLVAGLMGAVLYYLWHGKAPSKLKDYYFPTDAHGHRWSLPSYMKDVYAWSHDPLHTARGKVHPLAELAWEMLSNKDYFDKPIRNEHHSMTQQALEAAKHIGQAFVPIQFQPHKHETSEFGSERRALGTIGVTPAPKSLDHPTRH